MKKTGIEAIDDYKIENSFLKTIEASVDTSNIRTSLVLADFQISELKNEVGKYKQLEEEIGCPLEVVFKALKQDYVYTIVGKRGRLAIGFYGDFLALFYGKYEMLRVSNYKKTWWLKKDKSE